MLKYPLEKTEPYIHIYWSYFDKETSAVILSVHPLKLAAYIVQLAFIFMYLQNSNYLWTNVSIKGNQTAWQVNKYTYEDEAFNSIITRHKEILCLVESSKYVLFSFSSLVVVRNIFAEAIFKNNGLQFFYKALRKWITPIFSVKSWHVVFLFRGYRQ